MLALIALCLGLCGSQEVCDELIATPFLPRFGTNNWLDSGAGVLCNPTLPGWECPEFIPMSWNVPINVETYNPGPDSWAYVILPSNETTSSELKYSTPIQLHCGYYSIHALVSALGYTHDYVNVYPTFDAKIQHVSAEIDIGDTYNMYDNFTTLNVSLDEAYYDFSLKITAFPEAYAVINGIWIKACYVLEPDTSSKITSESHTQHDNKNNTTLVVILSVCGIFIGIATAAPIIWWCGQRYRRTHYHSIGDDAL